MTDTEKIRSEARAQILKALAHPSRIFIVDKLSEKPYCVYELTEMICSDRKEGTTVYYSLEAPCLLRFIGCVEQVIEQNIQKQLAGIRQSS